MFKTVSVDEALKKGHKMVITPSLIIIFLTLLLSLFLGVERIIPFYFIPIGFLLSFILAWLYWSVMITKWRLWAFDNVRNVHELKKRAILEKLIWKDGSVFEKMEIRNTAEKEKWQSLQEKFKQEDIFDNDLTISNETIIYYSKGKVFIGIIASLLFLGAGIYLLIYTKSYIMGPVFILIGLYSTYKEFKESTNTKPQIILNEQGIETSSTPFYKWADITNEEAISVYASKNHTNYYLTYNHPKGKERLLINEFDTNQKALNKLLVIYRGRNKENNTPH